jgi:hypothetical protein
MSKGIGIEVEFEGLSHALVFVVDDNRTRTGAIEADGDFFLPQIDRGLEAYGFEREGVVLFNLAIILCVE